MEVRVVRLFLIAADERSGTICGCQTARRDGSERMVGSVSIASIRVHGRVQMTDLAYGDFAGLFVEFIGAEPAAY